MTEQRGVRKRLTGIVVGNKMDKTSVVLVNRLKKHDAYKKYIRSRAKYLVHDPQNRCNVGDKVRIIESRPISKMKRWQVIEILEPAVISNQNEDVEQPEQKK
ncbi:MAG: 30S ribosomal protein S17 [Deltaproteobacteria bacterium]|nr:30S ribosomal protein S17 [Deltaproteobacteria bacterium]